MIDPRRDPTNVDLFEYQGKQYFARYGIPVSPGAPADTVDEAVAAAEDAGYPVVVKAQVQVGGRGKAGGIKLADNADEVREHAGNILGMDSKGHTVRRVWVEHASDIEEEYYASYPSNVWLSQLHFGGDRELKETFQLNCAFCHQQASPFMRCALITPGTSIR